MMALLNEPEAPMTSDEYVQNAVRTESVLPVTTTYHRGTLIAALKLAIHASNLVDQVKKNLYYQRALDNEAMARETSQVMTEAHRLLIATHGLLDDAPPAPITDDPVLLRVLHAGLGFFTEGGEVLEAVDKALDGLPLDLVNVGEEGGDIDWYKAILQDATGTHETDIRERNIAKLRKRYPHKFESQQAIHRDLDGERAVLEGRDTPPSV